MAAQPGWNAAALAVPLIAMNEEFTNIYFYPIYSPSAFAIDIEIYNREGSRLAKIENALSITKGQPALQKISLKSLCDELQIQTNNPLSARIIAREAGSRIPARIKIGLDIGAKPGNLPCNICTNLQPYNPDIENKPRTFRWAPLLDTLWIMNSSPMKNYERSAEVQITFHREQDNETISESATIPPHGFHLIRRNHVDAFLDGSIGWVALTSTNPNVITYYFEHTPSGIVAGDHGF